MLLEQISLHRDINLVKDLISEFPEIAENLEMKYLTNTFAFQEAVRVMQVHPDVASRTLTPLLNALMYLKSSLNTNVLQGALNLAKLYDMVSRQTDLAALDKAIFSMLPSTELRPLKRAAGNYAWAVRTHLMILRRIATFAAEETSNKNEEFRKGLCRAACSRLNISTMIVF